MPYLPDDEVFLDINMKLPKDTFDNRFQNKRTIEESNGYEEISFVTDLPASNNGCDWDDDDDDDVITSAFEDDFTDLALTIPYPIGRYREHGSLFKGCLIGEVGKPVSALLELFGNAGYICRQTFGWHQLDIKVMAFEAPTNYSEEGDFLIESMEINKEEFAQRLLDVDENNTYLLFTYMKMGDPQAGSWRCDEAVLKFLGEYRINKIQSIVRHRFVWELVHDTYTLSCIIHAES